MAEITIHALCRCFRIDEKRQYRKLGRRGVSMKAPSNGQDADTMDRTGAHGMLVLSRRGDESIVFPNLGITVKVLRVDRNKAKLGISAPPEVRIMRQEVEGLDLSTVGSESMHTIRNRLNTINLGMLVYQQHTNAGRIEEASETFERLLEDLTGAERDVVQARREITDACLKLLVVEDDVRQRDLLCNYLKYRGCSIDAVGTASDAIQTLQEKPAPDFVLLDLQLPGSDGAETIRKIRSSRCGSELKILAVSGTSPDSIPALKSGIAQVDRWFPKPTNPEALLDHMQSAMPVM